MSIASEIERLQTAKTDLKTAITVKGVTVADELTIDQYAALVTDIETGYDTSDADAGTSDVLYGHIFYNSNGRQVGRASFSVSSGYNTSDATATPEQVMSGAIFYNSGGRQTGTMPASEVSLSGDTFTVTEGYTAGYEYTLPAPAPPIKIAGPTVAYRYGSGYYPRDFTVGGGYTTLDATATPEQVMSGQIFYNSGGKQTGAMPDAVVSTATDEDTRVVVTTISSGYVPEVQTVSSGYDTADAAATPEQVMSGQVFYNSGGKQTGTLTIENLTSDGNAQPEQVVSGQIFYNSGGRQTGTMTGELFTADGNATPGQVMSGQIFYNSGGRQTGTLTVNDLTLDATITPEQVVSGQVFYNSDGKQTGTMPEAVVSTITDEDTRRVVTTISSGYVSEVQTVSSGYDTAGGNATPSQVIAGRIFYNSGGKQIGTMPHSPLITWHVDRTGSAYALADSEGYVSSGSVFRGSFLYYTSDGNATPEQVMAGAVFYNASGKQTGTLEVSSGGSPEMLVYSNDRIYGLDLPEKIATIQDVPVHNIAKRIYCMVINGKVYRTYGPTDGNRYTTEVISEGEDWVYVSPLKWDYAVLAGLDTAGTLYCSVNNHLNGFSTSSPVTWTKVADGVTAFAPCGDGGFWYLKGTKLYWSIYDRLGTNYEVEEVELARLITTWGGEGSGDLNGYAGIGIDTSGALIGFSWWNSGGDIYSFPISGRPADGGEWQDVDYQYSSYGYDGGGGYILATSTAGTLYYAVAPTSDPYGVTSGREVAWTPVEGVTDISTLPGHCESYTNYSWDDNTGEEIVTTAEATVALAIDGSGKLWKMTAQIENSELSGLSVEQIGTDTDWKWVPSTISRNATAYAQKGDSIVKLTASNTDIVTLTYTAVRSIPGKKMVGNPLLHYGSGIVLLPDN